MRKKYRKLNPGEAYACNLKDVKAYFGEEPDDVLIDFGTRRHYTPDSQDNEHVKLGGSIVAQMSVNCRDRNFIGATPFPPTFFLSFYVIELPYPPEVEKQFVDSYIPAIYEWYRRQRNRSATALSGVEVMLIALDGQVFRICEYRYH